MPVAVFCNSFEGPETKTKNPNHPKSLYLLSLIISYRTKFPIGPNIVGSTLTSRGQDSGS